MQKEKKTASRSFMIAECYFSGAKLHSEEICLLTILIQNLSETMSVNCL